MPLLSEVVYGLLLIRGAPVDQSAGSVWGFHLNTTPGYVTTCWPVMIKVVRSASLTAAADGNHLGLRVDYWINAVENSHGMKGSESIEQGLLARRDEHSSLFNIVIGTSPIRLCIDRKIILLAHIVGSCHELRCRRWAFVTPKCRILSSPNALLGYNESGSLYQWIRLTLLPSQD